MIETESLRYLIENYRFSRGDPGSREHALGELARALRQRKGKRRGGRGKGNAVSEHKAICERAAAHLALRVGFVLSGAPWYEINCVSEDDARALNELCREHKVAEPTWVPPLP